MRPARNRWLGWWYLAISIGFAILAVDHIVLKDSAAGVAVRTVIAVGFGILSWMELNKK